MKISVSKNLEELRRAAKERVDAAAARIRHREQTPGMEQIYADKQREAQEFFDNVTKTGRPSPAKEGSFLAAEVKRTGLDEWIVAHIWRTRAAETKKRLAEIETIRLDAKTAIDAATSPAEIEGIEKGLFYFSSMVNQD